MADTIILLGDFAFEDFEIPPEIAYGSEQKTSIYELVGRDRVVDALGASYAPIEWSGMFRGENAETRSMALEAMVEAGQAVALTFGSRAYTVLPHRFSGRYQRRYEIPYTLTLLVLTKDHAPAPLDAGPDINDMVAADMARSTTLAGKIGDGKLTGLIGNVQSAVDKVANFATATQEAIQGVLAPIVAVQNQVGSLMASAESIMSSVGSIGGVLPGLAPSVLTRGLVAQVSAFGQASDLFELGSSMGRMAKNLTTIGSAGAEVVVAGGDLMRLASATYGDASEWSTIAQANGLTDPKFAGLRRLLIPPSARGSGGVLSG